MTDALVPSDQLIPLATATLKFADSQEPAIKTLDAYISQVEEGRYGDKTPKVAQWLNGLRENRDELAAAVRGMRREGKRLGALAKEPVLGNVLSSLNMVIQSEAPGSAIYEQLVKARQAINDGLAGQPIPKPSDDA